MLLGYLAGCSIKRSKLSMNNDDIYISWKMIAITLAIALAAVLGVAFTDVTDRVEKIEATQSTVEQDLAKTLNQ